MKWRFQCFAVAVADYFGMHRWSSYLSCNRLFPSWLSCFPLKAVTWSEFVVTDNVNKSIFSLWMEETKRVCSLPQKAASSTMNLRSWVNVLKSRKVMKLGWELWNSFFFCNSVKGQFQVFQLSSLAHIASSVVLAGTVHTSKRNLFRWKYPFYLWTYNVYRYN